MTMARPYSHNPNHFNDCVGGQLSACDVKHDPHVHVSCCVVFDRPHPHEGRPFPPIEIAPVEFVGLISQ
jgi:hypothetical protein